MSASPFKFSATQDRICFSFMAFNLSETLSLEALNVAVTKELVINGCPSSCQRISGGGYPVVLHDITMFSDGLRNKMFSSPKLAVGLL